jgi:hypothetical protein
VSEYNRKPFPFGIADQIVDDVHHVVRIGVLFENEFHSVHIAVDTVNIDEFHGDEAFFLRCDDFTFGHTGAVEVILRIGHVVDMEAIFEDSCFGKAHVLAPAIVELFKCFFCSSVKLFSRSS